MTVCSSCGKELGFISSILGKKQCNTCLNEEREKTEMKKEKALAELHNQLQKNLRATSKDQLFDFRSNDPSFQSMLNSLAHTIKNDEKIYAFCLAKARRTKYVKSQRISASIPVFGLKGWRMSTGESVPIYDLVDIGAGLMTLTDKNIHLCASNGKPLKISYSKIEGFHLYDNGLELYHGLQKPTIFVFKEVDPIQSDVIGHIIDLHTR